MRKNVCFWNILKVRLQRTLTTCVRKCGLWRLFLLAWGVCEFTQKLSLDSIYCLIFHVGIILFAFHSQSKNISYFLAIGCLIGVRICSNGTSKSMVCIWFAINTAWLERPGKSATPNLAPTRFTTAVRTLRFGNIPSEDTFHISLPKRRRRTVAFRAPATAHSMRTCQKRFSNLLVKTATAVRAKDVCVQDRVWSFKAR